MKIILQRVTKASVTIDDSKKRSIGPGYVLLLGITHSDTKEQADWMVRKVLSLKLFSDNKKNFMEKSIAEIGGSILLVSQFTLYGEVKKGTKPNFTAATKPAEAKPLYDYVASQFRACADITVQTGEFGAKMEVELVNDGPVTLVLERSKGV